MKTNTVPAPDSIVPSFTMEELIAHNQGKMFLAIITFALADFEKGNPDILPCVYAWGYIDGEFKKNELPCTRHARLHYTSVHMRNIETPSVHEGSVNTKTLGDLWGGYFPKLQAVSHDSAVYFTGKCVMGLTIFFGDSIESLASEVFPPKDIEEIMKFGFPK